MLVCALVPGISSLVSAVALQLRDDVVTSRFMAFIPVTIL